MKLWKVRVRSVVGPGYSDSGPLTHDVFAVDRTDSISHALGDGVVSFKCLEWTEVDKPLSSFNGMEWMTRRLRRMQEEEAV